MKGGKKRGNMRHIIGFSRVATAEAREVWKTQKETDLIVLIFLFVPGFNEVVDHQLRMEDDTYIFGCRFYIGRRWTDRQLASLPLSCRVQLQKVINHPFFSIAVGKSMKPFRLLMQSDLKEMCFLSKAVTRDSLKWLIMCLIDPLRRISGAEEETSYWWKTGNSLFERYTDIQERVAMPTHSFSLLIRSTLNFLSHLFYFCSEFNGVLYVLCVWSTNGLQPTYSQMTNKWAPF